MAALYAAVDMNTLPFMHGRPYPRPSGRLGVADIVKVLLAHGADANQRAEDAAAAPAQQHEHAESRRGHDAADARRRVGRRGAHAAARSSTAPIRQLRQKNGTTMLMLASGFGRRGDHNADAQEYERGTPEELLRAVKLCVEELGLDPERRQRPGRHGPARGAQRRHRSLPRRARRPARCQEQARADAARDRARADRSQQPAAAAGGRGGAEGTVGRRALRRATGARRPSGGSHAPPVLRLETGSEDDVDTAPSGAHRRPCGLLALLRLVERDAGATEQARQPAAAASAATGHVAAHNDVVKQVLPRLSQPAREGRWPRARGARLVTACRRTPRCWRRSS